MKWHDGKLKYLHRYVWEQAHGPIPDGMTIDHINGDRMDNRLENLRAITQGEQVRNQRRRSAKVTGVLSYKDGRRWRVYVGVEGKRKYIGSYTDWFDAVCARMSANNTYGFHANHGRR